MKKIVALVFLATITQRLIAQTETFDIATYTAPKDWKKEANAGVIVYTDINTTTGSFCVLAMYACSATLGDA